MLRRTFLSIAGGIVSVPVGGASADVVSTGESQPTATGPTSPGEDDLESFDPDSVQAAVELGSREEVAKESRNRPHDVAVWNVTAADTTVDVRVSDTAGEHPPFEMTYGIPADDAVVVTLLEPAEYDVEIRAAASGATGTMTLPRSRFDCNDATTQVGVFEDGAVKSRLVTTLAYCPDTPVSGLPDDVNGSVWPES